MREISSSNGKRTINALGLGSWKSAGRSGGRNINPMKSRPRQLGGNAQFGTLTVARGFCCKIPPEILRGCRSVLGQKSRFWVTSAADAEREGNFDGFG
jgi:hypothetical protein